MHQTTSAAAPGAESALAPGVLRREVWSWAMYDFANSSYTTVVITAIFNAYFVAVVAGGAAWATLAWTAALAVSNLLLMVIGPVLGAYADLRANKKRLLLASTVGCVATTASLALAEPGTLALSVVLLVLSSVFYGIGENLVAAFLPELASGDSQGKVSGWGWSLGYLGGLLSLGICLAYVNWAIAHGEQARQYVPVTMLITAAMFGIASLPTFLLLRERAPRQSLPGTGLLRQTFGRLLQTLHRTRHYLDLRRFLLCIVVYQSGIQAVIALAAIYAQQAMGFSTQDAVVMIIVVNITAAVGAFAFGYVQDRIGHVATIALTLAGWILMVVLAWLAHDRGLFWLAANIAGLCLGASQSAARAFVGILSPATRRAEFFGLWGMAVRLASIIGPLTYGLATWLSQGDHRLAMLITGGYFVAGLAMLKSVDAERGKRAAQT
ncbi:MAG TPA: MFS transporter [Noviherbaspirillum sp.]|uniref:MFS transporter n=1 Tax=Noviherbaspirillum sp. TaxID=1926288 RepID=UPI002B4906C1|nr:MFS transporter [Noviherbaspirillum sp.]HJV88556.1 MFS transporter [Noviherbaspirillum sp.]